MKKLQEANKLNELISLELNRYISRKISSDITPKQHLCLIYLGNSKTVTAGEIGTILDISKSSISQLLNRLEQKGLVKRELNNDCKKEVLVSLGSKGQQYFDRYLKIKEKVLEEYFCFLEDEEIQVLYDLNKKILEHIRSRNEI